MTSKKRGTLMCAVFAALLNMGTAGGAAAQQDTPAQVEDIVVVARWLEAPIWRVRQGDSLLIAVGQIDGLPRDYSWNPDALKNTVSQADLVLYPMALRASVADVGRLFYRMQSVIRLPEGQTTADYLSPESQARLEAILGPEGRYNRHLGDIGRDLMNDLGHQNRTREVSEVVERSARAARVPSRPVGYMQGDKFVANVVDQDPRSQVRCLEAAITAAEAGGDQASHRADAWRRRQIVTLLDIPLQIASEECAMASLVGYSSQETTYWRDAIQEALSKPRATLAIVPLGLLARENDVLDQLAAAGATIEGPQWRAENPGVHAR